MFCRYFFLEWLQFISIYVKQTNLSFLKHKRSVHSSNQVYICRINRTPDDLFLLINSPEPKTQLTFFDQNMSVASCRCRRNTFTFSSFFPRTTRLIKEKVFRCFKICLLQTTWAVLANLETKHSWGYWFQFIQIIYKRPCCL